MSNRSLGGLHLGRTFNSSNLVSFLRVSCMHYILRVSDFSPRASVDWSVWFPTQAKSSPCPKACSSNHFKTWTASLHLCPSPESAKHLERAGTWKNKDNSHLLTSCSNVNVRSDRQLIGLRVTCDPTIVPSNWSNNTVYVFRSRYSRGQRFGLSVRAFELNSGLFMYGFGTFQWPAG